MREFSPSIVELIVAFAFGEVLSRSGLGLRERQCCTIATLLANGSAQAQLKFHMAGLLNVGGGVDDIVELLVLATALVGFPAAIAGADLLRELVAERSIAYQPHAASVPDDRYGRGRESIRRLLATDPEHYAGAFAEVSPAARPLGGRVRVRRRPGPRRPAGRDAPARRDHNARRAR